MNTDKFEEFCPGWKTNGYVITNRCCLVKTNKEIKVKIIEK